MNLLLRRFLRARAGRGCQISARSFVAGCALLAVGVLVLGRALPVWLLAAEVLATILSLFLARLVQVPGP